ncbi:MAG: serpin family protein, partial [Phycisphaeraceae bacterium]|nr:serpin family protein [Phycisphaeraceae bacterium]
NLFYSPYSISSAVSMAWVGARGETEKQFAKAMQLTEEQARDHGWVFPAFGKLSDHINDYQKGEDPPFVLSTANAIWGQSNYNFHQAYLDTLDKDYRAPLRLMNFIEDPDGSRIEINQWVERKTQDRIKNLLPEGSIDGMTRLVLTNAIYFKGKWANEFNPSSTRPMPFHTLESVASERVQPARAQMMHRTGDYRFVQTPDYKAIELPYVGGDLVMNVFLPKPGTFEKFEEGLTAAHLSELIGRVHEARMVEVRVHLPRFKMTVTPKLGETLKTLGLSDAFAPNRADFSGMTDDERLYIGAAVHKAFVEVNEEGTEAAAATGLVMRATAMPMDPPTFQADHPFIFVIRDRTSHAILFMGRVMDPTKE